jgi:hypothetical protein
MYSKMVPHHIEGMMIGFIWSMIKLNADVFGRLITVGLNQIFMVQGEMIMEGEIPLDVTPVEVVAELPEEMPFMNLYKIYLI